MTRILELLDRLSPFPPMDFSKWGDVEIKQLTRYQQLTGPVLGRNWVGIPHVTHHDEMDVSGGEANRRAWNTAHAGAKITPVAMVAKALVEVLRHFPMCSCLACRA